MELPIARIPQNPSDIERQLQQVARERANTFETLMDAAKDCSLCSMSHALYDVGGEYRRNM